MKTVLKPLPEQVIVITGASSGIGLATARAASACGAKLVLVARDEAALNQITSAINAAGGQALYVTADVGNALDIKRVLEQTLNHFGRIDTWVNNAGVDIWGRIEEVEDEDSHRLFETNFWGVVYGSKQAVQHMKASGGGAIITVGSIAGDSAFPLQGMYCASKHAVKAFIDAFRMELRADAVPISLTLVKPAAIGTPLQRQAKNYLAEEPRLPGPLYTPEEVARAILYAAVHPIRDINVGGVGRLITLVEKWPRLKDFLGTNFLIPSQKSAVPAKPRQDNLDAPGDWGGIAQDDPWSRSMHRSTYTRAKLAPWWQSAAFLATAVGVVALVMRNERPR